MTSSAVLNAVDEPHQWRQRLEHRARGVRVPLRVSSASQRDCLQDDAAGAVVRGDAASPGMKAEFEDAEIVITPRDETPSFEGSEEAPFTKLACAIINNYNVWKIPGCTEAGHYSGIAGAPTVICGPHGGAIHCANEYVTPAQLDKCREFVLKVAESLKASPARL
ncbi:putative metallo-peptidase, clan MH, family M18 [Trypanosoma cruzi]|uniref:Putative metallo-peptidase, clan MH, family M18 n=1 Tax=Trypanosoma cruzi TaxID=5693 RepID=A0A2V2UHA5_TRYCR|nr:putative metallo-peptidase, clan MH, family M18 [Trypanosoma cruzi]